MQRLPFSFAGGTEGRTRRGEICPLVAVEIQIAVLKLALGHFSFRRKFNKEETRSG